jgi:hypothetical protein
MLSKIKLMKIRNFYISNFFVNINCIVYNNNNNYIKINNIFINYFFKIIPLFFYKIISCFINIKFIYNYDNIYNITGINNYHILPYISNFIFYDVKINNSYLNEYNISNTIKYYNSSIPLNFILLNNNIESSKYLIIKFLNKNNFIEKKIYIKDYYNKLFYELFKDN